MATHRNCTEGRNRSSPVAASALVGNSNSEMERWKAGPNTLDAAPSTTKELNEEAMPGPYKRLSDIPQFTREGQYHINVSWRYLEETLQQFSEPDGIDLDPDFQRAHVWTETQQIRYVEFILRGGRSGRDILFNKSDWSRSEGRKEPMVLVDGKQRLQAVRRFMRNEIPAFGSFLSEYEDRPDLLRHGFIFVVNDLATRAEVLQWYIDLNAGGVVHTDNEIERVRQLLAAEA